MFYKVKKLQIFKMIWIFVFCFGELSAQKTLFSIQYDSIQFKIIQNADKVFFLSYCGKDSVVSDLSKSTFSFNTLDYKTEINLLDVRQIKITSILNDTLDESSTLNPLMQKSQFYLLSYQMPWDSINLPYEFNIDTVGMKREPYMIPGFGTPKGLVCECNRLTFNYVEKGMKKAKRTMYTVYFDPQKTTYHLDAHVLFLKYGNSFIRYHIDFIQRKNKVYFLLNYRDEKNSYWKYENIKIKFK